MEITGNRRRQQLAAIADLIEELTDFACITPLTTIVPLEFESAFSQLVSIDVRFKPIPLVGRGVLQAMGMRGGVRVRDRGGNDVTEVARLQSPAGPDAFDRRLSEAERELDRSVLRGPSNDEEEAALVADGWDPSAMRKVAENRARQEREFAELLATDTKWRRGRLRDVVAARYLALEFREVIDQAQEAHGFHIADLLPELEQARQFMDSMPAADAWITLRTAKHRNPDSIWLPNDIFDIDALAAAAPYCDVVVTERHSAHVLHQGHFPENYGTAIFADLDGLVEHLDESAESSGAP